MNDIIKERRRADPLKLFAMRKKMYVKEIHVSALAYEVYEIHNNTIFL